MADKDALRRSRSGPDFVDLHLAEGEAIREAVFRANGLYVVTDRRILRVRGPDAIDPQLDHEDAPWEQSVYLPCGGTDPIVARTIIQTSELTKAFLLPKGKQDELAAISWEVMSSLVSLRIIKERLQEKVLKAQEVIEADWEKFTVGKSPAPMPIVEYLEIDFRTFVNEVRRVLNSISELFGILSPLKLKAGHFHDAVKWAKAQHKDTLLDVTLYGAEIWVATWIAVRIAVEHPTRDRYVETQNFALEPNRGIRLPTWRLVHPDYDLARPQNLLDVLDICIENILDFFEHLQLSLIDLYFTTPPGISVGLQKIEREDRNPADPRRFRFHIVPRNFPPSASGPAKSSD